MVSIRSVRSILSVAVAALSLGVVSLAPGCNGKDPFNPGTELGVFHVSAKLTDTTCGGNTPNPWEFDVRLNHDRSTLYWIQGGAPIQGRVDAATAKTQLKSENVHDVRPANAKLKKAACAVSRVDLLDLTLNGADAKPTTDPAKMTAFEGGLFYTFTPTEGSDCADQVTSASNGAGGFDALPCQVHYDLTGAYKSPAP